MPNELAERLVPFPDHASDGDGAKDGISLAGDDQQLDYQCNQWDQDEGGDGGSREAFDGDVVSLRQTPEDLQSFRRVEHVMIPWLLLLIYDGSVGIADAHSEWGFYARLMMASVWVVLCVSLFTLGGRRNIDFRIARTLRRTWNVYVIVIASFLNVILDFSLSSGPFDAVRTHTVVYFACVITSTFHDALVEISPLLRTMAICFFTGTEAFLLVYYSFFSRDEVIWGLSKNSIKLVLFSQTFSCSIKAAKRVLLDHRRQYLTLPTGHLRRSGAQPVSSAGHLKREAACCMVMVFVAVVFSLQKVFPSHALLWSLFAGETVSLGLIVSIFWRNVDPKVLLALATSYEVVVIVLMSLAIALVNFFADRVAATVIDVGNTLSFIVLGCLYSSLDALRQRTLWFRRFCLIFFITIVLLNLILAQFIETEFKFDVNFSGAVKMTKSWRSVITACCLQIITLSVPAISCVITDTHQSKLALVRCKKPRPLPMADSYFDGWWRPSF